jgi:Thiamine monophosphate kinase
MDEFNLIRNYFQKLTKKNPSALKLNDDVFFDKKRKIVVSMDTYNEDYHYINFRNPDLIIKKIIRSSISDLFCKGVTPKYIFISGSGNKKYFNKKNLKLISKSIFEEQKKFNIMLSGGDTVTSKKSSFTIVTFGIF